MNFSKILMYSVLGFLLFSCNEDDVSSFDNSEARDGINATAITMDTFIGSWRLSELNADNEVDLNGDGVGSTDLFSETSCFDRSGVVFNADGTFTITNAKLYFEEGPNNDEFRCGEDSSLSGTWDVDEEDLILRANVNGTVINLRKAIELETNSFSFEITKFESDQYVSDAEGTVLENTRIVSLEYTRI